MVTGLTNPESVALNSQGQAFVTVIGERNRDGDGAVLKIEQGKAVPFATGLDDPKGLVAYQDWLFVADKTRVWRIDGSGKAEVFAPASAFPTPPLYFNDLAVDVESGTLYVSDSGTRQGGERSTGSRRRARRAWSWTRSDCRASTRQTACCSTGPRTCSWPISGPGCSPGSSWRIVLVETIAEGLGAADGLAWDQFGRLFVSDWKGGRVFVIGRPGRSPSSSPRG